MREDDGGLPALTEYTTLRFSPLSGGLTLLSMNPYSAPSSFGCSTRDSNESQVDATIRHAAAMVVMIGLDDLVV